MVSDTTLHRLRRVRTADIADALDSLGLQDRYDVDPSVHPLFDGIRFVGRARTQKYTLSGRPLDRMDYYEWARRQYLLEAGRPTAETLWFEPEWRMPLAKDDVVVIESGGHKAGILGSGNTLEMTIKGVVGFIIDGNCRDSFECRRQKMPVFSSVRSPVHPMGRLVPVSSDEPVVVGGVVIRPGDVVAADDDGVVVVPMEWADEAACRADLIQKDDRLERRQFYEALGIPNDETVELTE